jgi:hypothetical protein
MKNFTRYYHKIPASWIIAQKAMSKLNPKRSLRLTDYSHIVKGDIFITHTFNLCHINSCEVPNRHTLR